MSIQVVPDGTRWGHWFSASADLADNPASLAAEAWKSGGKVFWRVPKEKREMLSIMELAGVRMLGPKRCAPSNVYGQSEGCQNLAKYYDEMAKAKLASEAPQSDVFFALLKEEEEERQDPAAVEKKRLRDVTEERLAATKQLRYNDDAATNEFAKELAKDDPARGLFPAAYLEAIDEMDDLAPVLDL